MSARCAAVKSQPQSQLNPGLRARSLAGGLVALAVFAGGCSRGNDLGPNEAVEILVIDGINRAQAQCIVADLEDSMSLEKVTGIDTDLTVDEVESLAETSAACMPLVTVEGGVVGGSDPLSQLDIGGLIPERSVLIQDLLRGGMAPVVAECLVEAILESPDPIAALADEQLRVGKFLACEETAAAG